MTVLARARLEVDRTLRSRSFVARALSGGLEAPEYGDLVAQLGGLATIAAGDAAAELAECGDHDLGQLEAGRRPRPCPTLHLMSDACRGWDRLLRPEERWAASVGMLGTSWTLDAAERLEARFPGATRLLQGLGEQGLLSVQRLHARAHRPEVTAAAELMRGALLGLASHLDTTWPAPVTLSLVST